MKLYVVVNPKVKAQLLQWMKNEENAGESPLVEIKDLQQLSIIMQEMKDDFILDREKVYSVIACEEKLFLVEMPNHPMEIFGYVEHNPDKLKKSTMKFIMPILRIFLVHMFDQQEMRYA